MTGLAEQLQRIVDTDDEWDTRIHGSARARTTLRELLAGNPDPAAPSSSPDPS